MKYNENPSYVSMHDTDNSPEGSEFNQGQNSPSVRLNSKPKGEISLYYID